MLFAKRINVRNYLRIQNCEQLEALKKELLLLFPSESLEPVEALLEESAAQYSVLQKQLATKDVFLDLPFIRQRGSFQKIKFEFENFIARFESMSLFEPVYPRMIEIIRFPYFTILQSKIFQNIMHLLFCQQKGLASDAIGFLDFGESMTMNELNDLIHLTFARLEQDLFVEVGSCSLALDRLAEYFSEIDIDKELAIFDVLYSSQVANLFELFRHLQFSVKISEFAFNFEYFFEFFGVRQVGESALLNALRGSIESAPEFSVADLALEILEKGRCPEQKRRAVFDVLDRHSDILLVVRVFHRHRRTIEFVWKIYEDYFNHSDAQVDVMNEEIQRGGYKVKNIHLIYVKQLLRFLKSLRKKQFKSDSALFSFFLTRYAEEAKTLEPKADPSASEERRPLRRRMFQNSLFVQSYDSDS